MNKQLLAMFFLSAGGLSSCVSTGETIQYSTYQPYSYDEMRYYNQIYNNAGNAGYGYQTQQPREEVTVPDSYHVGSIHSPMSAKDRDKAWVSSQSPQGYTIEVADDEKPSAVAGKLYQLPKQNRMAEIKYQRNGKAYYKGVYGSYGSEEEAKKALESLPDNVKHQAGIKNWGSVQSSANEGQ